MSLLHLSLAKITEADLHKLKEGATQESRQIAYKRDWRLSEERDKKEFLADVCPMGFIRGLSPQMNFDGLMIRATADSNTVHSYVQLFRNGSIELVMCEVDSEFLYPEYEGHSAKGLKNAIAALDVLGVPPPYQVGLSLLNVKGRTMFVDPFRRASMSRILNVERDHLLLPELLVENSEAPLDEILSPSFTMVWNACGHNARPKVAT